MKPEWFQIIDLRCLGKRAQPALFGILAAYIAYTQYGVVPAKLLVYPCPCLLHPVLTTESRPVGIFSPF